MDQDLTCYRCHATILPVVQLDTGGMCRSCQKTIPERVELRDLIACMQGKDKRYRGTYFDRYCRRKPTIEALPILREAVVQDDHYLVNCAATSLGKLKAAARAAIPDLLAAASHLDPHGLPQSYDECLNALVAIDKSHPEILPLIRRFTHICNWVPISASLKALKTIGTTESAQLLAEIRDRWYSEFNKTQRRVADQLLADALAAARSTE